MTTHTPGPWTQHMNEETDIVISGDFQRGKHGSQIGDLIATVSCGMNNKQAANARLIAAAPALLEALKAGMKTLEKIGHADGFHAYEQMRQAKAQAEGKVKA